MTRIQNIRIYLTLVPVLLLACSPAADQRVAQITATADAVCRLVMRAEPLIVLAADRTGKPLDVYVSEACAAEAVVAPLVRAARDAYAWPTAGASSIQSATAGAAGDPR
jgi:hypothetical protein